MIGSNTYFSAFLFILIIANIIENQTTGYLIKRVAKFYEKMLVTYLVWNAQRKLKKLGRQSWASAIRTSDTDDWMK